MHADATNHWNKSPQVGRVLPRSLYSPEDENRAWRGSIEMARGRIRPTFVFGQRRILGLTWGRGPFSPDVFALRFHPAATMREKLETRQRLWDMNLSSTPFTTYDGIITDIMSGKFGRTYFMKTHTTAFSAANNWYDLWPVAGNPTSGTVNGTAFTARQFTDTTTGAIQHRGNVSTDLKYLLSMWAISSANTPMLMLYDRVLSYDLCTFNAAANQALTNTLTAQRYVSGAPGLLPMIASCTVNGATAANLTQFRYTNQAGTALQVAPTSATMTFIPSAAAPTATLGARIICPQTSGALVTWGFSLPLASGDTGCRLVNDYTTSAANTGTFCIILMHPLADLMIPIAAVPQEIDHVFQITDIEQIFDGACVSVMAYASLTTAANITGSMRYVW